MKPARTALVTGGSGGIGYHLCLELAATGTSVLVHAPTLTEARAATARLAGAGADPALLHPVAADFRRLDEVHSLAFDLRRRHHGLDLLINNAGALAPSGRTPDGIDTTFQINYVAPYALTRLLGPALNTAAGRIVTLTSALHREAALDTERPGEDIRRTADAYSQAHLALILFTRALARTSEQRVTAVAVHPGLIDTGSFAAVFGPGGLPAADGAAHVLHFAGPALDVVNGGYYEGVLPAQPHPRAADESQAVRLWLATARLLGWDYTAARLPRQPEQLVAARSD